MPFCFPRMEKFLQDFFLNFYKNLFLNKNRMQAGGPTGDDEFGSVMTMPREIRTTGLTSKYIGTVPIKEVYSKILNDTNPFFSYNGTIS